MAIPVARVHLKVAHEALPALLPTPPKWKMLRMLPTTPCVAVILPKRLAKPSRADADERWNAHKTKPASPASSPSPSSGGPRSANSVKSSAGHGSSPRKNTTSPPPKPGRGRADSVARWDAHKNAAAIPASSSGTCSVVSSKCSAISRALSGERWDVHKKRCQPQQALDDGESSSTGSSDVDDMEEEIVWKPRAMYAGPGFVSAAPEPTMLPIPSGFLVSAA